jgi:hypothetical protein
MPAAKIGIAGQGGGAALLVGATEIISRVGFHIPSPRPIHAARNI